LLRQQVKQMIDGWDKNQPVRWQTMLMALTNAQPLHLLDSNFFDFLGLQTEFIQN
jgi:tRNA 2-thiocytidine biosynthesis protein TtcA